METLFVVLFSSYEGEKAKKSVYEVKAIYPPCLDREACVTIISIVDSERPAPDWASSICLPSGPEEGGMGVYGIAVLGFFSCGISVILILT